MGETNTMNSAIRRSSLRLVAAAPLIALLAGCGAEHARYTPTADEARSSLEAALTAWRDGKPCGPIEAKPPIQVSDSVWQGGRILETFEIGPEEDVGDGTKQFDVTLKLKTDKAARAVRYVVHGREPVWVFNGDDYKHMLAMDNKPDTGARPKPAPRPSRRD
jgi:hypothetical protein